ncbi:hypothetical protein RJ55_07286 [Drechmeria coniospora]|nr:hypothetical protein RJ55_07286 [Drechmeria coniospora]
MVRHRPQPMDRWTKADGRTRGDWRGIKRDRDSKAGLEGQAKFGRRDGNVKEGKVKATLTPPAATDGRSFGPPWSMVVGGRWFGAVDEERASGRRRGSERSRKASGGTGTEQVLAGRAHGSGLERSAPRGEDTTNSSRRRLPAIVSPDWPCAAAVLLDDQAALPARVRVRHAAQWPRAHGLLQYSSFPAPRSRPAAPDWPSAVRSVPCHAGPKYLLIERAKAEQQTDRRWVRACRWLQHTSSTTTCVLVRASAKHGRYFSHGTQAANFPQAASGGAGRHRRAAANTGRDSSAGPENHAGGVPPVPHAMALLVPHQRVSARPGAKETMFTTISPPVDSEREFVHHASSQGAQRGQPRRWRLGSYLHAKVWKTAAAFSIHEQAYTYKHHHHHHLRVATSTVRTYRVCDGPSACVMGNVMDAATDRSRQRPFTKVLGGCTWVRCS